MDNDRHYLAERRFKDFESWTDWKKAWDKTDNVRILLSLLHCGFKIQVARSEFIERLQFYLQVADLHARWMIHDFGSSEVADLAKKAFQVLCVDFFDKPHHEIEEIMLLRHNDSVRAIMHFFRAEQKVNKSWLENLPPGSSIEPRFKNVAEKFILQYLPIVWEKATKAEITTSYSLQVVDILYAMQRLSDLLERPYCKDELRDKFDFNALEYLRQMARNPDFIPPTDIERPKKRGVLRSPEEAAALGSRPAQVYLLLRNRDEQFRRLKEIQDAEEAARVAQEKLAQLQQ